MSSPHGAVAQTAPQPFYERNGITLYQADYRAVLPTLADAAIDAIITDPPYATTNLHWDKPVEWPEFWAHAHRLCPLTAPMLLFASGSFTPKLIQTNARNFRYQLVWAKSSVSGFLDARRRPLRAHEQILLFTRRFKGCPYNPQMVVGTVHKRGCDGPAQPHYSAVQRTGTGASTDLYYPRDVLHYPLERRPDGRSWHPTAKPVDLLMWLVQTYSNPNSLILDPFAGSGSTLAAALKTGRRAIGCETNADYCARAVERLNLTERTLT